MEYGGMVHALEEIHRLLKPSGALIDIHPVAEPSPIEIHQSGKIDLVGYLSVRQWCIDFQQADNALTEIVQRGLFAVEQERVFDSLTYYASAAEMRTSLKESIDKFARDAQSAGEAVLHAEMLAARAEELMRSAGSEVELIVRERTHISRLKPT
jgi:ubiquinone/menaquinone biosynthesis C-methylase UbiE